MPFLFDFHARLAITATAFLAVLSLWAIVLGVRSRPLTSSWFGAAIIGELVILIQFISGILIYVQGGYLPRPFLHILYAIVAVITLPAGYGYLSRLENERALALGLGVICLFLTIVLLRASEVTA